MPETSPLPLLRKARPLLWLTLVIYWIALEVGTHLPLKETALPGNSDKLIHFLAYFGLAVLWGLCVASHRRLTPGVYLSIAVLLTISGYLEERTQPLVGRHYSLLDWLADVCGVAAGLVAVAVLLRVLCAGNPGNTGN